MLLSSSIKTAENTGIELNKKNLTVLSSDFSATDEARVLIWNKISYNL